MTKLFMYFLHLLKRITFIEYDYYYLHYKNYNMTTKYMSRNPIYLDMIDGHDRYPYLHDSTINCMFQKSILQCHFCH